MVVIGGRYRYAPKVFVDYLSSRMPGVHVCTKIPNDTDGRPVVTVSTVAAWPHSSPFMAWRGMVFGCHARTELEAGELCEWVRAEIRYCRFAHVCNAVAIVGEPARFDLLDEPTPRFQLNANALFREAYDHLTIIK